MKNLMRWLLPLSLAVNVSLVTIVVMHAMWERPQFPPGPPPGGPPNFLHVAERAARHLPKPDGEILIKSFKSHEAAMTRGHDAMRSAQEGVRQALASSESDAAQLKKAFDGISQARDMLDDALAETMVAAAIKMSPEGRQKLGAIGLGPPPPPGKGLPPPPPPGY